VEYVVTDYGWFNLRGRSAEERGELLKARASKFSWNLAKHAKTDWPS